MRIMLMHHQRYYELISQFAQDYLLVAILDQELHIPGRVGSPLSGIGRASTGSTATFRKKIKKGDKMQIDIYISSSLTQFLKCYVINTLHLYYTHITHC